MEASVFKIQILASSKIFNLLAISFFVFSALQLSPHSLYAKDFLIIGDSHSCGPFGKVLFENLMQKKHNVNLYCTPGSAAVHWNTGKKVNKQICQTMSSPDIKFKPCNSTNQIPTLTELLQRHPTSQVVLALGTNSLLSSTADVHYSQLAITTKQAQRDCFWVGPPNFNEEQATAFPKSRVLILKKNLAPFYTSLSDLLANSCVLVDSRNATAINTIGYDTVDGVHRTAAAGRYWATEIGQKIN